MKTILQLRSGRVEVAEDELLGLLESIGRAIELNNDMNPNLTQHEKGMIAGVLRSARHTTANVLESATARKPRG